MGKLVSIARQGRDIGNEQLECVILPVVDSQK